MEITIDEEKLYQLIKKAVSEVMEENIRELKLSLIPYVEDEEMNEIESIFGTPEKYEKQDFIKMEL